MGNKAVKLMRELADSVQSNYQIQSDGIVSKSIEINQRLCKENPSDSKKILMHTQEKYFLQLHITKQY